MTIYGWDASHYDSSPDRGPMNMGAAKAAGVQYFTHKVTEGTTFVDGMSPSILARAKAAGIPLLGGYHVLHSGNINAQVDWFLSHLPSWWDDGPFLVQLDVEHWPNDTPSAADIHAWVVRFLDVTAGQYTPFVYASKGQYGSATIMADVPLWNAAYPSGTARKLTAAYVAAGADTGEGWSPYAQPARLPAIWQYTSNATIGTQTQCDANAFRGTIEQLIALTRGGDMEQTDLVKGWNGKVRDVQVGWVLADWENLRDALVTAGGKGQFLDASALAGSPIGSLAALDQFMATTTAALTNLAATLGRLGEAVAQLQQAQAGAGALAITGGTITVAGGQVTTEAAPAKAMPFTTDDWVR